MVPFMIAVMPFMIDRMNVCMDVGRARTGSGPPAPPGGPPGPGMRGGSARGTVEAWRSTRP